MSFLVIMPVVTLLSLRTMDFLAKNRRPLWFYVLFYVVMLGCAFVFPVGKAHADEIPDIDFIEFYESTVNEKRLTPDMKIVYWKVATTCRREGYDHMYAAKNQSLLIPNWSAREYAHTAIGSAIATLPASTPQQKVVQALLVYLCAYLCKVYDNWSDIQYELDLAETCFKNADHYTELCEKA